MIGPRINAAGRMEHAQHAVRLLTSDDESDAKQFARILHDQNSTRQEVDRNITKSALQMIDDDPTFQSKNSTA